MKKCPFCAEEIQEEAIKCKHCKSELTPLTNSGKKQLAKKTKKENHIPGWIVLLLFVFVVFFIWFMNSGGNSPSGNSSSIEAKTEKIEKQRQKAIRYFAENKNKIYEDIKKEIESESYDKAIFIAQKYLITNDVTLLDLNNTAKTKKIRYALRSIPVSQFSKNKQLYMQLVKLNPANELYKKKLDFYSAKIKKEQEEKIARLAGKAQLRDSFFGDFTKAKVEMKMGKSTLQVWKPHIKYSNTLPPLMKEIMLHGVEKLQVEYDEIWKIWESGLDRTTLYWKDNKVQACTLENFYLGNPATGKKLSTPSYKVDNIYDRKSILNKLSE